MPYGLSGLAVFTPLRDARQERKSKRFAGKAASAKRQKETKIAATAVNTIEQYFQKDELPDSIKVNVPKQHLNSDSYASLKKLIAILGQEKLKQKTIQLNVQNNNLDPDGFRLIADALQNGNLSNLIELDISGNTIKEKDTLYILDALCASTIDLTKFKLLGIDESLDILLSNRIEALLSTQPSGRGIFRNPLEADYLQKISNVITTLRKFFPDTYATYQPKIELACSNAKRLKDVLESLLNINRDQGGLVVPTAGT